MSIKARETQPRLHVYVIECDHTDCENTCNVTAKNQRDTKGKLPEGWIEHCDKHCNVIKVFCPDHASNLHWTKQGLANLNRLIVVSFIKLGYSKGISATEIARRMKIPVKVVYVAAHKFKFSTKGKYKNNPLFAKTPKGIQRGRLKREQRIRDKTVPITLPGPDWAKRKNPAPPKP